MILLSVSTFLCLALLLLILVARVGLRSIASRTRSEARQLGLPLTVADLQSGTVAPSQNSAEIYDRIARLIKNTPQLKKIGIPNAYWTKDAAGRRAILPLIKPWIHVRIPEFELIEQIEARPSCRFPMDPNFSWQKALDRCDTMGNAISAAAVRADFEDLSGHWALGLKWLRLAHRITTDLASQPTMTGLRWRKMYSVEIDSVFAAIVSRHSADLKFLNNAQTQLRLETYQPMLREHLGEEIVAGLTSIKSPRTYLPLWGVPRKSLFYETGTNLLATQIVRDALDASFLAPWRAHWAEFDKSPEDWSRFRKTLLSVGKEVSDDPIATKDLTRMVCSELGRSCVDFASILSKSRLLYCSIELLKERAHSGRLPKKLSGALAEFGIDPIEGCPFTYRAVGDGFELSGSEGPSDKTGDFWAEPTIRWEPLNSIRFYGGVPRQLRFVGHPQS